MIPGYGPDCDLCTQAHYLFRCECGREWDAPSCPEQYACPDCGAQVNVTLEDHEAWLVVIGAK